MRRIARSAAGLLALVIAGGALALSHSGDRSAEAAGKVTRFRPFPLYWLGREFAGFPLAGFFRIQLPSSMAQLAAGERNGSNVAAVIYGTCRAESDSGCSPPLAIQVATACTRNYSLFAANPAGMGPPIVHTRVRGVPAIWVAGHLELYTGTITIDIDGDRPLILRAAAALGPANRAARELAEAGGHLPPPAPGHLAGTVPCPARS
jgi:hypothetical protein